MSDFNVGASLGAAYSSFMAAAGTCVKEGKYGANDNAFCGYAKAGTEGVTSAYTRTMNTVGTCVKEGKYGLNDNAFCGYVKAGTEGVTSAYTRTVNTVGTCINEGTYGTINEDPASNKFCGFAKGAKDNVYTPVAKKAGEIFESFKGMFSGKIFGIQVTAKGVGYTVAAVAATVVTAKAVQWLLSPAKKKVEQGYKLNF